MKTQQIHKDYLGFDFEAAGHKGGFDSLSFQQQRCLKAIFNYPLNPHTIPALAYSKTTINNDGSYRLIPIQRRRAQALLLAAAVLKLDFDTAQIGNPKYDGRFQDASIKLLADISGMRIKFNDDGEYQEDEIIEGVPLRFARAYRSVVEAGLITQIEQYREVEKVSEKGVKTLVKRAVTSNKILDLNIFVTMGALTESELVGMKQYAKAMKIKLRTKKQERKTAAQKAQSKVHQKKPRMSKRIQRIMSNVFVHMLSLYRDLKKRFPEKSSYWIREKVTNAYLT